MLNKSNTTLNTTETVHISKLCERELNLVNELANEHYANYIDLSNGINTIEQVRSLTSDINYTDMSDEDKYMAIYNRYTGAFGPSFLMADAISYPTYDRDNIYTNIITQFRTDMRTAFGSNRNAAKVLRTILYGDLSDADLKIGFTALYSPNNIMTLREFHYLTWNMAQVGFNSKLHEILFVATCFHNYNDNGITENNSTILREDLLDQRLDLRHICEAYNAMFKVGFVTIETGYLLRDLFGLSLDSRCFISAENVSYLNWDIVIDQWISDYRYYIEKNDKYPMSKTA